MNVTLRVTSDFGALKEAVKEIDWIPAAQDTAKGAIIDKTDAGVNADNIPLTPYKEGRHKRKREERGLRTDIKDLRFTGDMKAEFEATENTLTVSDRVMAKAAGNDEREDFFAVGDDTLEEIEEQVADEMLKLLLG